MRELLEGVRARIEASCARSGLSYPWWIPTASTGATAAIAVAAVIQRDALLPPASIALAGLLAMVPLLTWVLTGWLMPPLLDAVAVTMAVAILLTQPAYFDFAPLLLMVLAGEVAATARFTIAAGVMAVGSGVLVVAAAQGALTGAPLYLVGVLLGLVVGVALRWQMRAMEAERLNHAIRQEQAVSAERRRIARDVHDVVGHSLSITLLHLTGARHALQHDCDVTEAVEALTEAERVGRAAMADIRRSIGLLADGPAGNRPLPGIDDIAALVESTRAAGIDVGYRQDGDLSTVEGSSGLGLYRIAQESLANIAKHAPSATASVHLAAGVAGVRLTVRNTVAAVRAPSRTGDGLAGMATRADQLGATLHAGPNGPDWVVDVTVPFTGAAPARGGCPLRPVTP